MIKTILAATLLTSILTTGAFAAAASINPPVSSKTAIQVMPAATMKKMSILKKCPKGSHYMMQKCRVMKKK